MTFHKGMSQHRRKNKNEVKTDRAKGEQNSKVKNTVFLLQDLHTDNVNTVRSLLSTSKRRYCSNPKPMTLRVAPYFSSEHAIAALPYGSANGNW